MATILAKSLPRRGLAPPRSVVTHRAIRRLRLSICFRILVFTRKPPCFGLGEVVVILNTSENTEGFRVFSSNNPSKPCRVRLAKG